MTRMVPVFVNAGPIVETPVPPEVTPDLRNVPSFSMKPLLKPLDKVLSSVMSYSAPA